MTLYMFIGQVVNKLINTCSDMTARLSCENASINLIWAKISANITIVISSSEKLA